MAALLGEGDARLPFVDPRTVSLSTNHTLAGNRNRFQSGLVSIASSRPAAVPRPFDRALIRSITWPVAAILRSRREGPRRFDLPRVAARKGSLN